MFIGRALLLCLATTLAFGQLPPRPASSSKPNAGGGNQQKSPTPNPKEYLVEVYPLPAFCLDKWDGSIATAPPVGPRTACANNQLRIQAQNASDIAKALASDA